MTLQSPATGEVLRRDTPHSLQDESGNRWPVVDGIPYLRTGRDEWVADVLARLDAGDARGALVELLREADDWWDEPPPRRADIEGLLDARHSLTLRQTMAALGFGRVGDYFAHRWSDPTYLAGLGLIAAHWTQPASALELACGIGHYLRVLEQRGVAATGLDVVFAKLWLARHFVVGPEVQLICCDAAAPWPVASRTFDLVLCQDAFYFLEPKPGILARLRAAVAPGGTLLVGHVHNRDAANASPGAALAPGDAEALFPQADSYDDAELTRAVAEGREARPRSLAALRDADAFAFAEPRRTAAPLPFGMPDTGRLRRNPLYAERPGGWAIEWPSARYEAEYAPLATYPVRDASLEPTPDAIRRRIFVDLPERW